MTRKKEYTSESVLGMCREYMSEEDLAFVQKAHDYAQAAHEGQYRMSGEPFFIHPVHVAGILADMKLDVATIATGFLHDVVEDTDVTLSDIEEEFSETVAFLVDGVTKLGKYQFKSKEEELAENHRKMMLATAEDIRVVIVKLADRLHNMQTMNYQTHQKQIEKSRETIEIYAPLAARIGMSNMKWELEDLGLRYLNPEAYYEIVDKMDSRREEREGYINEIIDMIYDAISDLGIEAEINGRPKHIYSIYRKMVDQSRKFEDIYDLLAIRVITNSVKDCYAVLGAVHTKWKPMPGRFKDYVAMPKANMYQSLHTTVIGPEGKPVEIQIRTHQMHEVAEYGVAAHWSYKQGNKQKVDEDSSVQKQMNFFRNLNEYIDDAEDASDFMDSVKTDLFQDEVYIFTPKGDVFELPEGSCTVDFAYHVHTEVGQKMIGAKVNGNIVPLEYKLKNGDIVEILTNPNSSGPSRDWLKIVTTSKARNRIKRHFKSLEKERYIEEGRQELETSLKEVGYSLKDLTRDRRDDKILNRYNFSKLDDLYAAIGNGEITPGAVINFLGLRQSKEKPIKLTQNPETQHQKPQVQRTVHESGVVVEGVDNLMIRLSRCCNPVPGDEIAGYVTRGRGISVHRKDCPNLNSEDDLDSRLIHVYWDSQDQITEEYESEIAITGFDRSGFVNDVLHVVSHTVKNLISVVGKANDDGTAIVTIKVLVSNTSQLEDLMEKIKNIPDCYTVSRIVS